MNAIAYCGLACCLCSEKENCAGCQDGGCEAHGWCKNYICCREKGIAGCWECASFPCGEGMFVKPRIKAFAEFARRYGADELERCLLRNRDQGVVYHDAGKLTGDYDRCADEEAILRLIRSGPVSSSAE